MTVENGRSRITESIIGSGSAGSCEIGSIAVDQNYGGPNELCYVSNGVPVDNAEIVAYLKSDYDANRRTQEFVKGTSRTNVQGNWVRPILLDPGFYVLQFSVQGVYGPDIVCIEVVI